MTTCSHLDEVRQSLAAGQWPHAAAPELRAHAETCTRCAQEVLLTTHFQQTRTQTIAAAQPEAASLLWWRAQIRRRNAALARAGRPIAAAQGFALAVALLCIAAVVATHWASLLSRTLSVPGAAAALTSDIGLVPLILAITLITTLGGVALYLSTDRH